MVKVTMMEMVMVMVAVMVMKAVFALNLPAHCLTSPTLRETPGKKEDLRLSFSISIKLRRLSVILNVTCLQL